MSSKNALYECKKLNNRYTFIEATLLATLTPDKEVTPIDNKPDHCEYFQTNRHLILPEEPVIRVSR